MVGEKSKTTKILGAVFFVVFIVIVVWPFLWLLVTSLKDPQDIMAIPTDLFPKKFSLKFFKLCFTDHHLGKNLLNSVIVSTAAMLLSIAVALPAAYAFSRYNFKFKQFWQRFILVSNMFPIIAIVTPMFIIFKKMKLINTYWGLIIPSVITVMPMAIWTMIAFIKTLPFELEEAAMIDGCSRFQSVLRIVVPLCAPGVFTTGIIAFIGAWNEMMFSLILVTKDAMRTVPVAIAMFPGEYTVPWGDMAAASIISTLPIIIVVLICQKKIVAGLTTGAVKG